MTQRPLASLIFNVLFFCVTAVLCIAYIPLLLLPRPYFIRAVRFWCDVTGFLERTILGLHYEIRGAHNLPKDGSFIVAAKHQSAYETFKLHALFNDPAIVLKRELLSIPLWGAYLRKSDVIAINRSTPKMAQNSMILGALRMKQQGRPIIIFPQGTRVEPSATTRDKPYKSGIAGIQSATGLPIIPLALNSGLFWPRRGFFKCGGKVVFEFMEPIAPGKDKKELMTMLEDKIEKESSRLMSEAQLSAAENEKPPGPSKTPLFFLVMLALLFGAYSYAWFQTAALTKQRYNEVLRDLTGDETRPDLVLVSGYPGPIKLEVLQERIETRRGNMVIKNLQGRFWPMPFLPVHLRSNEITVENVRWARPLVLDGLEADLKFHQNIITITNSTVRQDSFVANITGDINTAQEPIPALDLVVAFKNHQAMLARLANDRIIDSRSALFIGAGFSALADQEGVVRVPLIQRGDTLYAGPMAVLKIPAEPAR